MPTSAEIAAQLEAAQSESATGNETVETELNQAAAAEGTPKQTGSNTEGSKGKQSGNKAPESIPYSRFKEKVDAFDDLKKQFDRLTQDSERAAAREAEYQRRIQELSEDSETLDRVRALHDDEDFREVVEKIDRKLKGIEEDVASGKKTEKQGEAETSKLLQQFKQLEQKIQEEAADQRTELLWQRVMDVTEKLLESLDGYEDNEKRIIAGMMRPVTDWVKIDEDPSVMKTELAEGFKRALVEYGEPRGVLKSKLAEIEQNSATVDTQSKARSAEEQVQEILARDDFGKFEVDKDGKFLKPTVSDEEFVASLAKIKRLTG